MNGRTKNLPAPKSSNELSPELCFLSKDGTPRTKVCDSCEALLAGFCGKIPNMQYNADRDTRKVW